MRLTKVTLVGVAALAGVHSAAAPAAVAAEHTVRIVTDYDTLNLSFEPKTLRVEPGDTVTWVNEVAEEHSMVTYPDGYPEGAAGFASETMTVEGQRWSHRFTVPGTYQYLCVPHLMLGMHATIIVGKPSAEQEFHKPSREEILRFKELVSSIFDEDEYDFTARAHRHGAGEK